MDKFPFKLCRVNRIIVPVGLPKGDRRLPKGDGVRVSEHLADVELQVCDRVGVGDHKFEDETLINLHRPGIRNVVGHLQVILLQVICNLEVTCCNQHLLGNPSILDLENTV